MQEVTGYITAGENYSYDRYGNLTGTVNIQGYSTKYSGSYDSEGNLKSATRFTTEDGAKSANMSYTHDGLGNTLTVKNIKAYIDHQSDVTTTKIYDYTKEIPTVLAEYSTDGTIIKYTYAEENLKINAEVRNNLVYDFGTKDYSLVTDRLGSTRYAIDSEGAVAASAEYNAWGEVIEETGIYLSENAGTLMIATSYTGYSYERDLDWWDAGARMYAPDLKRFISRDPESGNVYEPVRINRYIFAGNNPVNNIDPNGRSFEKIVCDVGNALNTITNKVINTAGALLDNAVTRKIAELYEMIPPEVKGIVGTAGLIAMVAAAGPELAIAMAVSEVLVGGATGAVMYAMSETPKETGIVRIS